METLASTSPISSGTTTPSAYEDDAIPTSDAEHCPEGDSVSSPEDDAVVFGQATGDALRSSRKEAEHGPQETMSRLLKGKEQEWRAVAAKEGPLTLLDLPVDVLKEIIHQLPHTNDLTSLALCHSALHGLTIPYIYSRFDIVWPDANTHAEPRTGVDALTYGLATLVMAEEVFNNGSKPRAAHANQSSHTLAGSCRALYPLPQQRRGNYYGRFTKKFSLGNGPADWVQEYLITKEGGKMLGTLVALAVARMKSLETFVWDMPTGILRDVWLALSSLADRNDPENCRLDRVWIRWHDNSQNDLATAPVPPPPMPVSNLVPTAGANGAHTSGVSSGQAPIAVAANAIHTIALDRVEHPTFSVLPALKSLSVLDIDELPYLDEMSVLIARSQVKLKELRVGIARHAQQRDWVTPWEGDGAQQVDYEVSWNGVSSRIPDRRLGGVLGILVGRVFNMRRNAHTPRSLLTEDANTQLSPTKSTLTTHKNEIDSPEPVTTGQGSSSNPSSTEQHPVDPFGVDTGPGSAATTGAHSRTASRDIEPHESKSRQVTQVDHGAEYPSQQNYEDYLDRTLGPELSERLHLETLELERVPISVSVLLKAFDWSVLTTLTLLHCHNHEALWKSLRRRFSPRSSSQNVGSGIASSSRSGSLGFSLNLKKIHTNAVSPALISFLKETLAPNSLEVLFLQEGRSYSSNVTVDAIYKGPIRRHKGSLKKLLIDSSEKGSDGHATTGTRWRRWMISRDVLTFLTSGRMANLKELAISIDYRDWHFFLQRLPQIPQLRSLYIPNVADHAHGTSPDSKELALQIVDIVHLRPEVELCYMGIQSKCFEILENQPSSYEFRHDSHVNADGSALHGYTAVDAMASDDEGEDTEEEDEDDLDGSGMNGENDDTESETSDDGHDDSDGEDSYLHEDDSRYPKLRLREILFYDDKVAIFKARHGRL